MVKRLAKSKEDDCLISSIEIQFAVPCYISQAQQSALLDVIESIITNDKNQFEEGVHWLSELGSKPNWSQADAKLLGLPVNANAPETGEPTFNDEVFYVASTAREFVDEEEKEKYSKRRQR